ncbi:hypothetical protein CIK05_14170 [Bdellovibrio sp. qaytius]|nr:hypothetical protein CIK05_14170 [Bdellovibrio sp. qaytius]
MKRNIILFSLSFFLSIFSFAADKKSNEKFEKPVAKFMPALQTCRESATSQTFLVSGKVVVYYEVNDKAEIQRIKINDDQTTLKDLNLQMCVLGVIKKIKFPKAPKGTIVSISYPIIFK